MRIGARVSQKIFRAIVQMPVAPAYSEIFFRYLDRGKATTVNFAAVTTPVLAIRAECDRCITPQVAPWIAARYRRGTYVEIPRSDHLVFNGEALPVTMGPYRRLDC